MFFISIRSQQTDLSNTYFYFSNDFYANNYDKYVNL